MDNRYNGWTNYATWRVNLEIFDGMNLWEHFDSTADVYEVKEWARQFADDVVFMDCGEGLARDYAAAFLSDVDWYEIAQHLIDAAKEDAA